MDCAVLRPDRCQQVWGECRIARGGQSEGVSS